MEGTIFKIERYSLHNGPGIRTTLFMKGCPLRCLWCGNPESQGSHDEIMYNPNLCLDECKECLEVCSVKAIQKRNGSKIVLNRKSCDHCGRCTEVCPSKALSLLGMKISVEEALRELLRDTVFYETSGGGITLSGGEPLEQPTFVLELLKACKSKNIHTALDTCGYCEWEIFEEILKYTDLLLYDIKLVDSKKHKKYTGRDNDLILRNLRKISQDRSSSLVIRFPLIPGINDTEEEVGKLVHLLRTLSFRGFDILPYHRLGLFKYEMLGRPYPLEKIEAPSKEQIDAFRSALHTKGFEARVEI